MDKLNLKAQENLKLLLNLNVNDNLISENGELQIQDEYVQVENTNEIEYAIYLTFNQLLYWNNYNNIYRNDIFNQIDKCIDNIFDNKQLNHLIETTNLKIIIDDIDEKLDLMKERYYYGSPFFSCFKNIYGFLYNVNVIFKENNEIINKTLKIMNKDIYREYYQDDDNSDNSDNCDSDNDDSDNDSKNKVE